MARKDENRVRSKTVSFYVNPCFNPDVEFAKDTCYRDIPAVDSSLFIIARKLILESK